jgi:orotate phosphoribosyltransferase-like protein
LKAAKYLLDLASVGRGAGLSDRFAKGYSGKDISAELQISESTVVFTVSKLARLTAQAWEEHNAQ